MFPPRAHFSSTMGASQKNIAVSPAMAASTTCVDEEVKSGVSSLWLRGDLPSPLGAFALGNALCHRITRQPDAAMCFSEIYSG